MANKKYTVDIVNSRFTTYRAKTLDECEAFLRRCGLLDGQIKKGIVTVTDGEECQVYKATRAWKVDESQKITPVIVYDKV